MKDQERDLLVSLLHLHRNNQATPEQTRQMLGLLRNAAPKVYFQFLESNDPMLEQMRVKADFELMYRETIAGLDNNNYTFGRESLWQRLNGGFFRVAAVVAVIAGITFYLLHTNFIRQQPLSQIEQRSKDAFIRLPDESVVILKAGSKLLYEAPFGKQQRTVRLEGEAYFNIALKAGKPFMVRTGAISTTVLGTAFNIKAVGGGKVIVTVETGKVKVENSANKVLAVLQQNEQLQVDMAAAKTVRETIKAAESIVWMQEGMRFKESSLREVAEKLNSRYGVAIQFARPALAACAVNVSFTGKESLEYVLEVLTQITNTHYEIKGSAVTIFGKGCS